MFFLELLGLAGGAGDRQIYKLAFVQMLPLPRPPSPLPPPPRSPLPPGTWQGVDIWLVFVDPLLTLPPFLKESKALSREMELQDGSSVP